MSSNDGLNLVAIVAGVRAIVDAIDTALELWHALPAHIDDTGTLELGDRWRTGAGIDLATIGLGVLIDRPTARDPGDDTTVRVTLTAGPFHAFVSYDGRTEADLEALDVVDHGDDVPPRAGTVITTRAQLEALPGGTVIGRGAGLSAYRRDRRDLGRWERDGYGGSVATGEVPLPARVEHRELTAAGAR